MWMIIIHAPDKSGGKRRQKVEIIFNFVDEVEVPVLAEPMIAESTLGRKKRRDLHGHTVLCPNRKTYSSLRLLSLDFTGLFYPSSSSSGKGFWLLPQTSIDVFGELLKRILKIHWNPLKHKFVLSSLYHHALFVLFYETSTRLIRKYPNWCILRQMTLCCKKYISLFKQTTDLIIVTTF